LGGYTGIYYALDLEIMTPLSHSDVLFLCHDVESGAYQYYDDHTFGMGELDGGYQGFGEVFTPLGVGMEFIFFGQDSFTLLLDNSTALSAHTNGQSSITYMRDTSVKTLHPSDCWWLEQGATGEISSPWNGREDFYDEKTASLSMEPSNMQVCHEGELAYAAQVAPETSSKRLFKGPTFDIGFGATVTDTDCNDKEGCQNCYFLWKTMEDGFMAASHYWCESENMPVDDFDSIPFEDNNVRWGIYSRVFEDVISCDKLMENKQAFDM
jgi:hypothetical protein